MSEMPSVDSLRESCEMLPRVGSPKSSLSRSINGKPLSNPLSLPPPRARTKGPTMMATLISLETLLLGCSCSVISVRMRCWFCDWLALWTPAPNPGYLEELVVMMTEMTWANEWLGCLCNTCLTSRLEGADERSSHAQYKKRCTLVTLLLRLAPDATLTGCCTLALSRRKSVYKGRHPPREHSLF